MEAALALYDGMANAAQRTEQTFNTVIFHFEAVQKAGSAAEEKISKADEEQKKLNESIERGKKALKGFLSKIKDLGKGIEKQIKIPNVFQLSDAYASVNARLNPLVEDGGSREALEQQLMASAQRSRTGYFDTATAVADLGMNAGAAFAGNDEMIAFTEQVNKQFAIGGATAQQQSNGMAQLTQAMASGTLRGEELNSILAGAPGIASAIEQYMGAAEGSIQEYAAQGLVTAQVVKNALFAAAEETNAKFEGMPKTWAQVWTSMENNALAVLFPILQQINDMANGERLSHILDGFIGALGTAAGIIGKVLELAVAFGGMVYDNWSLIGPIVLGIAGALGVYAAGLAIVNTVELVGNVLKLAAAAASYAKAAFTQKEVAANAKAIATQWGLNEALLACPLTWIVAAIVAVIAGIYALVGLINLCAGTSISATGIIAGVFSTLFAQVANNTVIPMQRLFASFVNFFGNVFNDPAAAVKVLFYDLCITVIGYVLNMAQAIETLINKIPGVSVDITSGLDGFYRGLEEARQKVKDESGWVEYVKQMDYIDLEQAAKGGYAFGQGVDDKVKGMFSLDGMDAFDLDGNLDSIYAGVEDTAYNTAAMADEMDIAEENLAYMRDIAEREAINRYTTAQVTIHQQNENHISSQMDLDEVMDVFGSGLAEQMAVSGEGVHA